MSFLSKNVFLLKYLKYNTVKNGPRIELASHK